MFSDTGRIGTECIRVQRAMAKDARGEVSEASPNSAATNRSVHQVSPNAIIAALVGVS